MALTSSLLSKHLFKVVRSLEKEGKLSLIQNTLAFPLSTGSLTLDYFYNGGILPMMYTIAGPEQSGKSLTATTILASAYKQNVDGLVYFDAEETLNGDTVGNLFGTSNVSDLFSMRKEGKVEIAPRVHVFKGNSLEGVMDGVTNIVNNLPDKIYIEGEESWFFKFDKDSKEDKELLGILGLELDAAVTKKHGADKFLLCRDPHSKPKESGIQAVIIIDSLAILITDTEDEEGPTQQMALEARRFAKHLKRFVGRLAKKQVVVLAINHVKQNPNAGPYKSPDYESGGNAIKFLAGVQTRVSSISSSTAGWGGNGAVYEEESVHQEGFQDRYQFKKFKLVKDKVGGNANKDTFLRVWMEDCFGESRGFDPVMDTIQFLKATNQMEEHRGRFTITGHPALKEKSFTFKQLKKLILATAIDDARYKMTREEFLEEFKVEALFNLREWCFNQIKNREVFESKTVALTDLAKGKDGRPIIEDFDEETGEVINKRVEQI